jgi:hypothetical protein
MRQIRRPALVRLSVALPVVWRAALPQVRQLEE